MLDITSHISTYKQAKAGAAIKVGDAELIEKIRQKSLPKGDILEIARTAGILAAKQTGNIIPNCHNVPIENVSIDFEIIDQAIHCEATVSTVHKSGVTMEAIYAASVTAITLFDLLKSFDQSLEITSVKVIDKTGGKSNYYEKTPKELSAGILICSDAVLKGQKKDKAGDIIKKKLMKYHMTVSNHEVLPNQENAIKSKVLEICPLVNILVIAGGTGVLQKDNSPETIKPLLDKEIPGISEAARNYGQDRTPFAMLSRGITGIIGNTLILVIPGSSRGAKETMDALFPYILHVFKFQKL